MVEQDAPNHSAKDSEYSVGGNGVFVQSEVVIENQGVRLGAISVYGQGKRTLRPFGRAKRARRVRPNFTRPKQSNPTTWRHAAMNMAMRGIDFNFGKHPADTFLADQHPDLRADYVMANPPFNISEWWDGRLEGDPRRTYGTSPRSNANFAWVQHMLHHLAPHGSIALLLANASMSSNTKGESDIHRALVEADRIVHSSRTDRA